MSEDRDGAIQRLVGEALDASQRGDAAEARRLAGDILRQDPDNREAAEIARLSDHSPAELRRLTILFCDLVGSTAMSVRHEPGEYGQMLELYHRNCEDIIDANGGRVTRRVGDGILALFGHPSAHEDDTRRAVRAGRALVERMRAIRAEVADRFDDAFEIRVAVHHGLVHLDLVESQVYGLAPNLAARLQDLADSDQVVVSDQVAGIVGELFELADHEPVELKGIQGLVGYHTVLDERPETPRRGRRWATRFVGRSDECAAIHDFVDLRREPDHPLAVITGRAGIGKSRLVEEALSTAPAAPAQRLLSVCSPYEQEVELGACRPLLAPGGTPVQVDDPARLRQLRADLITVGLAPDEHIPLLAPVLGLDPTVGFAPSESDLSRRRDLTTESIRAWLAALADGGLLIHVEDLQWADDASRELLFGLSSDPIPNVRVVATARAEDFPDAIDRAVVIDLAPLGASDARELAAHAAPRIDPDSLERVLARGHGVPLFLEELAGVGDQGEEVTPDMRARLSETSTVPDVLYEPLVSRLCQPSIDLRVAQVAATIGTSFDTAVLAASMGRGTESMATAVQALGEADLVHEASPGTFRFRHSLVRDIAYDLQPAEDRRDTHRRVGHALSARQAERRAGSWTVIAHHFHSAGDAIEAVDAYGRAAAETRDLGGLSSARDLLSTALELIATLGPSDRQRLLEVTTRLQRAFLSVTMAGNADPHARADYETCAELLREHEAGPEFVDTLVSMWGYYTAVGSLHRSEELLDEIRETGVCSDPRYDAQNLGARGLVAFLRGQFDRARSEFAAADAVRPDDVAEDDSPSRWQFPNDPLVVEEAFRGSLAWQLGDLDACLAHRRRARHRAELLAFPHGPFSLCYALHYGVWVDLEIGEFDRAQRLLEELSEIADRLGFDFWSVSAASLQSTLTAAVELTRTDPDPAALVTESERQSSLRSVISLIDSRAFLPFGLTRQAAVADVLGDHQGALGLLDQAESSAEQTGACFYLAETWRTRARVLRDLEPERSLHALDRALAIATEQGAIVFARRAERDLDELGRAVGRR